MRFRFPSAAALLIAFSVPGTDASYAQTGEQTGTALVLSVPECAAGLVEGHFPSYIEDSFSQLKAAVPGLHGLKLDENGTPNDGEKILNEMGAAIAAMLPRVPNLIAKEEVSQASLALPYMVSTGNRTDNNSGGGRGSRGGPTASAPSAPLQRAGDNSEVRDALQAILNAPKNHIQFSYRIQSNPDVAAEVGLREFRTNAQNEAILTASTSPGSPRGVGFGSAWLMFEPSRLNQLRFRYLGRQRFGKHETVVLAFAQIPERVTGSAQISVAGNTCSYFRQGVVWIDPSIYQMVRLQTDLLAPLIAFRQRKLRSEIDFSEVKIPARNLTLWMPNRVEISWEMESQAGAEIHKYSDYRLFGSTSRLLIPDPE